MTFGMCVGDPDYPAPKRVPPGTKVEINGREYRIEWSSFDGKYLTLTEVTNE